MALRISVTTLESFRLYLTEEWKPESELLDEIRGEFKATPKMLLGRSGHCAMEGRFAHEDPGGHLCYGFRWPRAVVTECREAFRSGGVPEVKVEKVLSINGEDVTLVGKADRLIGTEIVEHKFTLSTFNAERYQDSMQWRSYMLLFQPSVVLYTVFCVSEGKAERGVSTLALRDIHRLGFYPYPAVEGDVRELLVRFIEYVDLRGLRGYLQPRAA